MCSSCRSDKTSKNIFGRPKWYRYYIDSNMYSYLCARCYNNLVSNKIHNKRHLRFKGKQLLLKENPRVGVCNLCRNVAPFDCKRTSIHHEIYDENEPLRGGLEICNICHGIVTYYGKA